MCRLAQVVQCAFVCVLLYPQGLAGPVLLGFVVLVMWCGWCARVCVCWCVARVRVAYFAMFCLSAAVWSSSAVTCTQGVVMPG